MARPINKLAARFVLTVKEPGRHADGGGLYLYLDKTGGKRWVFMFTWKGERKEMGLGSAAPGGVGLAAARTAAEGFRAQVQAGVNPIEDRRRNKAAEDAPTFGQVADDLVESLRPQWKSKKNGDQWKMTLTTYAAPLRDIPVDQVTTEDVLDALKPIWLRIPETARRTRSRIEHVLDAAKAKGQRSGENPARWKGHLQRLLPKSQMLSRGHHAAMPWAEAPGFLAEVRQRDATAARALEFTVLTVVRTSEALGALWGEIDREAKVWTIPAVRMKGPKGVAREHRVPLAPRVVEILDEQWEVRKRRRPPSDPSQDFVFPGARAGRPLSNMAMDMLLRRMERDEYTVHGFRSTFRDWAGDATNFPRELVEAALAHLVGNKVEQAYRRGDALVKRQKLMEAWASYCGRAAGGNVVPLSRGAK